MKNGDLIKESWRFHGFRGSGSIYDICSIEEYKSPDICYRILKYDESIIYDVNRVNKLGWPVSEYKIEQISSDAAEYLENNKWDDYYKCYRIKEIIKDNEKFADIEDGSKY